MKTYTKVSIAEVSSYILAVWDAGEFPNLIGVPGIGKTDVSGDAARLYAGTVAARLGIDPSAIPFLQRSMATQTAEDIVIPDRDPSGAILHKPVGAYRVACDRPAVVMLDELNRCQHSTQNALLCVVQNGIVGDYKLHPESRLIGAMNDAEEEGGDGAHERISALADRMVDIHVEATFAGWFDYALARIGAPGSTLQALAVDYAFCADRSRELLSLTPQPGVDKRPSPRAIRKGLGVFDAALTRGMDEAQARTLLAGCIGEEAARCYLAIRKLRTKLPSATDIANDPLGCLLPAENDIAWAAAGLIGSVALKQPNPAWLYLGRFPSTLAEVKMATGKMLTRGAPPPTLPDALKVKSVQLGMEGLARAGQNVPGLTW